MGKSQPDNAENSTHFKDRLVLGILTNKDGIELVVTLILVK